MEFCASVVICFSLGLLTWQQSHQYANAETLYRATIERNPSAWLARNNLAALLLEGEPDDRRVREAERQLQEAIRLKPDYAEAHYNLGTALERTGDMTAATAAYHRVLELDPGQPRALERLAVMRHDRASRLLKEGLGLESADRIADAEKAYREAASLDPARAIIRRSLGRALQRLDRGDEAIVEYRASLELDPTSAETHNDLGVLLAQRGRLADAIVQFQRALQLDPNNDAARENLARAQSSPQSHRGAEKRF